MARRRTADPPRLTIWTLASISLVAAAVLIVHFGNLGDYLQDAGPSVIGLSHWDLHAAFAHPPLMGFLSILLRAPIVAITRLMGGGQALQYESGCLVCLIPVAMIGAWLAASSRGLRRSVILPLLVVLVAVINPATVGAVGIGHPEEALGAALCVGAVLLVTRGHLFAGAVTLGLALATKQWALLAVGPTLLAVPAGRRMRLVGVAACSVLLASAIQIVANPSGFLDMTRTATDPGTLPTSPGSWLFLVSRTIQLHLTIPAGSASMLNTHHAPVLITAAARIFLVAAMVPLTLLAARRGQRREGSTFALLALLFLIRCVLDPIDNVYYNLPLVLAVLAWEIAGRRRAIPVVTLLTAFALWVTFDLMTHSTLGLTNLVYMAWSVGLMLYLGREVLGREPAADTTKLRRLAVAH